MSFLVVSFVLFFGLYAVFLYRGNFCTNFLICQVPCDKGYKKSGLMCMKPCEAGKQNVGLLCRQRCRDGYVEKGGVCWQKCPEGYTNTGAFCQKGTCRTFWDKCKYRPILFGKRRCVGALVTRCEKFHTMTKKSYVPPTTARDTYVLTKALSPLLKTIFTFTILMVAYIIFRIMKFIFGSIGSLGGSAQTATS